MSSPRSQPTPKQVAHLNLYGVPIPPLRSAASALLTYIWRGNGTQWGLTRAERAVTFDAYWQSYVGKKVLKVRNGDNRGCTGEVESVLIRPESEVELIRRDAFQPFDPVFPFVVVVRWNDGRNRGFTSRVEIDKLELLNGNKAN